MAAMRRFVGRRRELRTLQTAYDDPTFQFVALYGRRRVGKTSLLNEFAKDKRNVFFFTGIKSTLRGNLTALSEAIATQLLYRQDGTTPSTSDGFGNRELSESFLATSVGPVFETLPSAIEAVFALASRLDRRAGRPVVIIDEYPYLAASDPSISSVLQQLIDRTKDASDLMLVLCGSSMSFMERQVLGEESPLYGRRTRQIKLMPMDAFESAEVLIANGAEAQHQGSRSDAGPAPLDPLRAIESYGIAGGIPLYLEQLDVGRPLETDLAENVFSLDAFLYGEPGNFLSQEVRRPESYNAIIQAIASGRTQPGEIADVAGIDRESLAPYLRRLQEMQIVRRWTPVPAQHGGRAGYRIADPLFGFWYGITSRYADAVEAGKGERIARRVLEGEFPSYLGSVFEEVCRQWVRREMAEDRIPVLPREIGKWWGTDPATRRPADIDVTATTHDGLLVLGECKWRNEPVDVAVLRTLRSRASLFRADEVLLLAFSKSGFTEGALAYAAEHADLRLLTAGELFD